MPPEPSAPVHYIVTDLLRTVGSRGEMGSIGNGHCTSAPESGFEPHMVSSKTQQKKIDSVIHMVPADPANEPDDYLALS